MNAPNDPRECKHFWLLWRRERDGDHIVKVWHCIKCGVEETVSTRGADKNVKRRLAMIHKSERK